MFQLLSKISLRWRYALLYVLILFVFAFVYRLLPGDHFYHSNIAREPMLRRDKNRISEELTREIINTFQSHHGGNQKSVGNWKIDARTFQVLFLEATDKGNDVDIRFKLDMKLTDASNPRISLMLDPVVTFSATEGSESTESGDVGNVPRNKTVIVDVPEVPYWEKKENIDFAKTFFPTPGVTASQNREAANPEKVSVSPPEVIMPISKSLSDSILNLAKGIQGNPSNLSGYYERMLYLSAVTITTLGYGDIAPLTTLARILVLSEAVIGIIVIGLFINAGSQKKPEKPPAANPAIPAAPDLPAK